MYYLLEKDGIISTNYWKKKEFLKDIENLFLKDFDLNSENKAETLKIKGFPNHAAIFSKESDCALILTSNERLITQDNIETWTLPFILNNFIQVCNDCMYKGSISDKKIQFCCFTLLNNDAQRKALKMGALVTKRGLNFANDVK